MERHTFYTEYTPRTPPPSPIKFTSLDCAEPNEANKSTYCALHLVDRKIEAHQSTLSPMQHRKTPCPCSPAFWSHDVSGQKLQCFDESMHRMAPVRQNSLPPDDDEMTPENSSYYSSRTRGIRTTINDFPSVREVDSYSTAFGVHNQCKTTTSLQSETQLPSSTPRRFCLSNLRSCREAIADVPSRFIFPSPSNDPSRPRTPVTGMNIPPPAPVGSSKIPDVAVSPPKYKHNKTKSWPGPCNWLPAVDNVSIRKAATRPKSRKCDTTCAFCRERTARFNDGGMLGCAICLPGSDSRSSHKYSLTLQPLAENVRGEEVIDEGQAVIVEEERSHFSDCSSDEEDDDEKVPSNTGLFNSLGRLNRRSRTRLSWSNLFSKP